MAELALEKELVEPCVFHCQQAIEKLLKAIWIEQNSSGQPRYVHDLVALGEDARLSFSDEQQTFLQLLTEAYTTTRYADDEPQYSLDAAVRYFQQAEETFSWLQQQMN